MSTPQTSAGRIWVTLLLDGGQRESLSVAVEDPLLDQLCGVLRGDPAAPALIELMLREGTALLTIPKQRLIGVLTEPPIPLSLPAQRHAPAAAAAPAPTPGPVVIASPPDLPQGLSRTQAAQIGKVLTPDQHAQLLQFATDNEALFNASGTVAGGPGYRQSRVCHRFAPFDQLIGARVRALLPKVCASLNLPLPTGGIDIQLTAHQHGDYYKLHNDNSGEVLAHRAISFVYYFHRSPKAFTGGQLRLHDRDVQGNRLQAAGTWKDIEPLDNTLVFFNASELHEVLPVVSDSRDFADSRFTVNGWVALV